MNRDCMLKRLTVLDFLAVDLQLYLDSHPDDENAITKYNSVVDEADGLREQYENLYGPLFSFRSYSKRAVINRIPPKATAAGTTQSLKRNQ